MEKIKLKHTFDKNEALERLQALTDYWKTKGINAEWNGFTGKLDGKVKGFEFSGELIIEDSEVLASVKANLIARKVGRTYVTGKLEHYLDPKNSLDSLKS